jgi:hypothetical protein
MLLLVTFLIRVGIERCGHLQAGTPRMHLTMPSPILRIRQRLRRHPVRHLSEMLHWIR